jgi:putative FmdB family regulatory protein
MPIYEYKCKECTKKFSILVPLAPRRTVRCPDCGGNNLERLMSTFAYHRSIKTIHDESGEPTLIPKAEFYRDPRNIGRWTEKRFRELGLEMPGEVVRDIQVAREGEIPGS